MANFAAPTLHRTWQFQVNQAIAAQGTLALTNARILRFLKNSLTGAGAWTDAAGAGTTATGNWTVESSSDGAGGFGNNDQNDRWAADGNVIWANPGTNHSWIVLKQTGIPGGDYYFMIDCQGTATENIVVSWSKNQYTGGTATARPTSVNEIAYSRAYGGSSSGNPANVLHVMKSSDGKASRAIICRGGFSSGLFLLEEMQFAPPGWTNPAVCAVLGQGTAAPGSSALVQTNFSNAGSLLFGAQVNGQAAFWIAHLVYGNGTSLVTGPTVQSDLMAAWPVYRVGAQARWNNALNSTTPMVESRGEIGIFRDLWWCQSQLAEGDQAPAAGTRNFVMLGDLCFPWNTTAITLT